ncbi:MAG TPA: type II toxin-antitoxin system VapC family toxin [Gemmatimonadaceae bacterium]
MNILVYAFRDDSREHAVHLEWLNGLVQSDEAYAVSDHVLSGFLRIVTHPRVFHPPTPIDAALSFANAFRQQPNAVAIQPGARHWEIFERLCRDTGARGNLVPDAWLAALAIESGCEFVTTDRDYSRFADLRWRHPLTESG